MNIPISSDLALKTLDSRIGKLEQAVQISAGKLVLQIGATKITITNQDIVLEAQGNIQVKAAKSATIAASGPLTLKGSVINEN